MFVYFVLSLWDFFFLFSSFFAQTQSVFSLGYGEDDDTEGDVLTVPLGSGRLVSAVDEVDVVVVVVVGRHGAAAVDDDDANCRCSN